MGTILTLDAYVGQFATHPDWTDRRRANAVGLLLPAVNRLISFAEADGVLFLINPETKTIISGVRYGGFRPQECKQGAPLSNHKEGLGADLYDPYNKIDKWCMANSEKGGKLEQCGIWLEHPSATQTWSHWQAVPPGSKKRVYYP